MEYAREHRWISSVRISTFSAPFSFGRRIACAVNRYVGISMGSSSLRCRFDSITHNQLGIYQLVFIDLPPDSTTVVSVVQLCCIIRSDTIIVPCGVIFFGRTFVGDLRSYHDISW